MSDALTLSRWLSPAFPVGAFAWSHGVEQAVAEGWIADAAGLEAWLADLLGQGSARSDGLLLAAAWHGREPVEALDAEARAFAASAERLEETSEQGAAFTRTLKASGGPDLPALTYPVAVGAAARASGFDLDLTLEMFLSAFVSNLVSAAIRLGVLGQTAGQGVLTRLEPGIAEAAGAVAHGDLEYLATATLRSDLAAIGHEQLQPRLFRS